MNLKPALLVATLAVACGALALAPASLAAVPDGTITFTGTVTAASCTVKGPTSAGSNNFAVALPTVSANTLTANGTGPYAASNTGFTMTLSGCPAGAKVGAQFYSAANADTATGNGTLKGTGVAGVDVQLLDSTNTAVTIGTAVPTGNANVTDQTTVSSGGATLNYSAQYYATSAYAGAGGAVSTTVNYVINYQ